MAKRKGHLAWCPIFQHPGTCLQAVEEIATQANRVPDLQAALQRAQEERDRLKFRSDSYPCDRCGAVYGMDASLPNSEWKAIAGGDYDILCLWCIEELAQEKGLTYKAHLYFPGKAGRSALYEGDKDERWPELLNQVRGELEGLLEIHHSLCHAHLDRTKAPNKTGWRNCGVGACVRYAPAKAQEQSGQEEGDPPDPPDPTDPNP